MRGTYLGRSSLLRKPSSVLAVLALIDQLETFVASIVLYIAFAEPDNEIPRPYHK